MPLCSHENAPKAHAANQQAVQAVPRFCTFRIPNISSRVLVGLHAGFRQVNPLSVQHPGVCAGEIQTEVIIRNALEPRGTGAVKEPALAGVLVQLHQRPGKVERGLLHVVERRDEQLVV